MKTSGAQNFHTTPPQPFIIHNNFQSKIMSTLLALIIVCAIFFPALILAAIGLLFGAGNKKRKDEMDLEKYKHQEQLRKKLDMEDLDN